MPVDHIRYDILVQEALRGMVRNVLADTAKGGLSGDHHFYIKFDTTADGVGMSDRLLERYPEEMTIVLQYQFWDLKVTDSLFEVNLSFGGVAERLVIPFAAIREFKDPSVQFMLQFETLAETDDEAVDDAGPAEEAKPNARPPAGKGAKQETRPQEATNEPTRTSVPASPPPAGPEAGQPASKPDAGPDRSGGAEVVRLDRFRKK